MFDIAKVVEKTKRTREKNLKKTIKTIYRQIKGQINAGKTYAYFSLWNDENIEVAKIVKYFENKGYIVSSHDFGKNTNIEISWDYVEEGK